LGAALGTAGVGVAFGAAFGKAVGALAFGAAAGGVGCLDAMVDVAATAAICEVVAGPAGCLATPANVNVKSENMYNIVATQIIGGRFKY
jgi:hypothetical protein